VGPLAATNNVTQQAIYLTRGNVLDWDIMALPQDPDKDKQALLEVLGSLAGNGLLPAAEQKCTLAVNAWAAARRRNVAPTERDQQIVTRLQSIQALGTAPDVLSSEAAKLPGFLAALDR